MTTNDDLPEWSELYGHFGTEAPAVVDNAVVSAFPFNLDPESGYLHTEHISHAVLTALYRDGYRITK